jgi:hypothetical protein
MTRSASFFGRALQGMLAARELQANSAVAPYLLSLDDDALVTLGHDRKTVARWARRPSSLI